MPNLTQQGYFTLNKHSKMCLEGESEQIEVIKTTDVCRVDKIFGACHRPRPQRRPNELIMSLTLDATSA